MKCINCGVEVDVDDNFCYKCGHWTANGYKYLQDYSNVKKIENGTVYKHNKKLNNLIVLFSLGVVIFTGMLLIRGSDLFAPFFYVKKQITNLINGYNTSIIKVDNIYNNIPINSYEEARDFINKDFLKQSILCDNKNKLLQIETDIENQNDIASVTFCDMNYDEVLKIQEVINKMFNLFPSTKGALTNITITNAASNTEYIAYFQPMHQFVNINNDIKEYNKVNKTQILLNSYYYLNNDLLSNSITNVVGENFYVKNATWESAIAHEIGHYITFAAYLKEKNIDNITYVTEENEEKINELVKEFDQGSFAKNILNTALNNYNIKYSKNLNLNDFAKTISNYAATLDKNNNLLCEETIAEAIHDYYLNGSNMQNSSREIVYTLKNYLR